MNEPQAGVSVHMIPGDPPPFVHSHTVCLVVGVVVPAQDEAAYLKIKEAFQHGLGEVLTRAFRNAADQIIPPTVNAALEDRGVVYESSLRRFMSKPGA